MKKGTREREIHNSNAVGSLKRERERGDGKKNKRH